MNSVFFTTIVSSKVLQAVLHLPLLPNHSLYPPPSSLPPAPSSISRSLHPTIPDFIHEKRDLFLSELAIEAAQSELQRLERIETDQKTLLESKSAEVTLVQDQFRTFLINDGKVTMESRQAAEAKARQRIDRVRRIRDVSSEVRLRVLTNGCKNIKITNHS
jgi:hypothetical protein